MDAYFLGCINFFEKFFSYCLHVIYMYTTFAVQQNNKCMTELENAIISHIEAQPTVRGFWFKNQLSVQHVTSILKKRRFPAVIHNFIALLNACGYQIVKK